MSKQYTLRTETIDNLALELELNYAGDRFVTEIRVFNGDTWSAPVLKSCEGNGRQRWPPSPPIQQLLRQEHESGEFFAGIGMAGTSHWSLSIAPVEADRPTLEFDVACRVKEEPAGLSSCYEILGTTAMAVETGVQVALCDGRLLLESVRDQTACEVLIENGQLKIVAQDQQGPLPRTVRWKYRLSSVRPSS